MSRALKVGLIGVVILVVVWFTFRTGQTPIASGRIPLQRMPGEASRLEPGDKAKSADQGSAGQLPLMEMKEASYVVDYAALARSRENLPFRMRGGGGNGKVVDQQGNVLMESGEEIRIFGVAVGPDKQHVLVEGGSAVNIVLNPATGLRLRLPLTPPGEHMMGFGWRWIGATKLLGESGVQAFNADGTPVNCCEGHNVAQSRLYVYDVATQKLSGVNLPGKVTQPVVNVAEVSSDGHVHLVHEVPHAGTQQDLGWFRIETK